MMDKMKMETKDLTQDNIEKIEELFPGVVTEAMDPSTKKVKKAVDFDALRQILSDTIVEGGSERYNFTWPGKKEAILEANRPIRKTLRPCIEESRDWNNTKNIYIKGDNLDALKLLRESYLSSIKMIYIDPPYNTGYDFIYRDSYKTESKKYSELIGEYDSNENIMFKNTDSNGRFHSDWCSMIYSRLVMARDLLSDNGVIFISIDDHEIDNLLKICTEIFGEKNHVCNFIWKSKQGKVGTTSTVSTTHEYIVCFARNIEKVTFEMIRTQSEGRKENLRQWGQADRREDRPSMWYPITIDGVTVYPIKEDGTEGRWRVGQDMCNELQNAGQLELMKKNDMMNIYRIFPPAESITPYDTILTDVGTTAKGAITLKKLDMSRTFDYSKPVELLCFLEKLCTTNEDVILDFFSGSGTSAHATMFLNSQDHKNRKYILVQIPEQCDSSDESYSKGYTNICDVGIERIKRAGELYKEDCDVGCRVFVVDDTNMKDIYYSSEDHKQKLIDGLVDNIKENRTDLDLLYGILLDWGLKPSLSVEKFNIDSKDVYSVDSNVLVACFAYDISELVIREISKMKPTFAVFRDSSFKNLQDKINLEELFKNESSETTIKVI